MLLDKRHFHPSSSNAMHLCVAPEETDPSSSLFLTLQRQPRKLLRTWNGAPVKCTRRGDASFKTHTRQPGGADKTLAQHSGSEHYTHALYYDTQPSASQSTVSSCFNEQKRQELAVKLKQRKREWGFLTQHRPSIIACHSLS